MAQMVHLAPEVGYFISPDLLLSVQARIQFLSGADHSADSRDCGGDVCRRRRAVAGVRAS